MFGLLLVLVFLRWRGVGWIALSPSFPPPPSLLPSPSLHSLSTPHPLGRLPEAQLDEVAVERQEGVYQPLARLGGAPLGRQDERRRGLLAGAGAALCDAGHRPQRLVGRGVEQQALVLLFV